MKTFGEQAKIILEVYPSTPHPVVHYFNRALQNIGFKQEGGGIINTKFDPFKSYFLNIVSAGINTFGLFAAKEVDDALHNLQEYCKGQEIRTLLEKIAVRGLPKQHMPEVFNIPTLGDNGKVYYKQATITGLDDTNINKKIVKCNNCGATGKITDKNGNKIPCPTCNGSGQTSVNTTTPEEMLKEIVKNRIQFEQLIPTNANLLTKNMWISAKEALITAEERIKKEMDTIEQYGDLPRIQTIPYTDDMVSDKGELLELKIPLFIQKISETAQSVARRSYGGGFTLDTIFTGYIGATRRGQMAFLSPEERRELIPIKIQEKLHADIMIPIFVDKKYLIYTTNEQYEKLKKGGLLPNLGRFTGAVANQLYQAGAQAPKVKL